MSNNEYHRQIAMAYHNGETIQCRLCRSRFGSDWTDLDRRPSFNPQYEYRIKPEETNMKPHKHAELIKAWADGAEIEVRMFNSGKGWSEWEYHPLPCWTTNGPIHFEYRIKPQEVPQWRKDIARALQDGKIVEFHMHDDVWVTSESSAEDFLNPHFTRYKADYRIKPEPKPDYKTLLCFYEDGSIEEFRYGCCRGFPVETVEVTRDGETRLVKSIEL